MSQTKTAQPLTGAEKVCQSAANSISIYYFSRLFQAPHAIHMRNGLKMGNTEIVDTTVHDGLTDAFNKIHMGITG